LRLKPAQTHALRGFLELFLFPGGYGGLSIVEEDIANLCLVARSLELRKVGGLARLLETILDENRHLQSCLQDAMPLWEKPLAISPIPYGHFAGLSAGLWCVGDQAAVMPSFTGDGMAIALHSGALAVQMYLNHETANRYHDLLHTQLGL
jgi:menaquinone-9 beta-reductase